MHNINITPLFLNVIFLIYNSKITNKPSKVSNQKLAFFPSENNHLCECLLWDTAFPPTHPSPQSHDIKAKHIILSVIRQKQVQPSEVQVTR